MSVEPFALLVVGFLLTSVVGGALAYTFQQRGWDNQYRVERRDHLQEQALKTYEEVSTLLDQRLYRMRLLFWAAKRRALRPATAASVQGDLDAYRAVLVTWNDNLNRILALVDTYFGETARVLLEDGLYEEYSAIGEELDEFVREVSGTHSEPLRVRPVGARLSGLSRQVYEFNVALLRSLRDNQLGAAAVVTIPPSMRGGDTIRFGHKGDGVRRLQLALTRSGATGIAADGHFGRGTERALRDFQQAHGLRDDGIAGPETAAALGGGGRLVAR